MFEQGALQIADGLAERPALMKEMTGMRMKMTSKVHEQYEARSSGKHDDNVSTLSLEYWAVRKVHRSGVGREERTGSVSDFVATSGASSGSDRNRSGAPLPTLIRPQLAECPGDFVTKDAP
jgi:hypothetical protein